MSSLLARIRSRLRLPFQENPFPWALYLLASDAWLILKNCILGIIFRAPGLFLGPGCVIRGVRNMSFGRKFSAHGSLWLEAISSYEGMQYAPRIFLGNNIALSDGVHITCIHRIEIGDFLLAGSHVYISDHQHGAYKGAQQSHPSEPPSLRALGGGGPVKIGKNVWIGDNAVLLGPLEIGDGSIIGANSIVTRSVAPNTIVAGAPARAIKRYNSVTLQWERVEA